MGRSVQALTMVDENHPLEEVKIPNAIAFGIFGAGGRTRTGTPSLAVDFESTTSTNSITPAENRNIIQEVLPEGKGYFQTKYTSFLGFWSIHFQGHVI